MDYHSYIPWAAVILAAVSSFIISKARWKRFPIIYLMVILPVVFVYLNSISIWMKVPLMLIAIVWIPFMYRTMFREDTAVKKIATDGTGTAKYVCSNFIPTTIIALVILAGLTIAAPLIDAFNIIERINNPYESMMKWERLEIDITINWFNLFISFGVVFLFALLSSTYASFVAIRNKGLVALEKPSLELPVKWNGLWGILYRASYTFLGIRTFFGGSVPEEANVCPTSRWIIISPLTFLCGIISWVIIAAIITLFELIFLFCGILFYNNIAYISLSNGEMKTVGLPVAKVGRRRLAFIPVVIWTAAAIKLIYHIGSPVANFTYEKALVPVGTGIVNKWGTIGLVLIVLICAAAFVVAITSIVNTLRNPNSYAGAVIRSWYHGMCRKIRWIGRPPIKKEPVVVEEPVEPFRVLVVSGKQPLLNISVNLTIHPLEVEAVTKEPGEEEPSPPKPIKRTAHTNENGIAAFNPDISGKERKVEIDIGGKPVDVGDTDLLLRQDTKVKIDLTLAIAS